MLNIVIRPTSPSLFLEAVAGLFRGKHQDRAAHTHGTTRHYRVGDRAIYDQTEIVLQPSPKETPEAFAWRVWQEAGDGDEILCKWRGAELVGAVITRRLPIPLRLVPGEPFELFAARLKAHAKELPRA